MSRKKKYTLFNKSGTTETKSLKQTSEKGFEYQKEILFLWYLEKKFFG